VAPGHDQPRWGVGDAVAGWMVAYAGAVVGGALILSIAHPAKDRNGNPVLSLALIALLQLPLWFGFVGAPVYAAAKKGQGVVRDFGLRVRAPDVAVGVAVGLVSQWVLVPLVSLPWLRLLGKTTEDMGKVAQQLTDKATNPLGVVLLVLIVAIGAPIAEELFFRGLVFRSVQRWLGPVPGIAISALAFGATHFELLQFPALTAFGAVLAWLAWRTGRLGPGIVAHMAFNGIVVVSLVSHRLG